MNNIELAKKALDAFLRTHEKLLTDLAKVATERGTILGWRVGDSESPLPQKLPGLDKFLNCSR